MTFCINKALKFLVAQHKGKNNPDRAFNACKKIMQDDIPLPSRQGLYISFASLGMTEGKEGYGFISPQIVRTLSYLGGGGE